MKPVPADQAFSDALGKLVAAARADGADPETKQLARRAAAKRYGGFLRGVIGGAELARLALVSETKAFEYLDPKATKAGLSAAQLPLLDPMRFRASLAWAIETHRAVWGDDCAALTREQLAMVALAAMSDAENDIAKSMFGDLRIDTLDARGMTPKLLHAYRKIRALLVALGVDPDSEDP